LVLKIEYVSCTHTGVSVTVSLYKLEQRAFTSDIMNIFQQYFSAGVVAIGLTFVV